MPAGDGVEGPDVGMRGSLPRKTQTLFANLDEKRKLNLRIMDFFGLCRFRSWAFGSHLDLNCHPERVII